MAVEKYIAAASLGLFAMFVGEMISIYTFMVNPPDMEFGFDLEPDPKILQFISIGVAPASIMAGVSYIMSKRYGSKSIGLMIIAGGVILLIGMAYINTLLEKIESKYLVDSVVLSPPIFMGVSIPVIVVGSLLLRIKKKKPSKEYV